VIDALEPGCEHHAVESRDVVARAQVPAANAVRGAREAAPGVEVLDPADVAEDGLALLSGQVRLEGELVAVVEVAIDASLDESAPRLVQCRRHRLLRQP